MAPSARHAEISGAGIAGLAAAIALAKRGWSVCVHERSAALRPEGAGIYIWDNGLRVLAALDARDEALEGCHRGERRETRNERNQVISSGSLGGDSPIRVVSIARQKLLGALYASARRQGVEVRFGAEAVAASAQGEIAFSDGSRRKADLVVAADGINSRIRDSLGLLQSRRPLKDGAIRCMIDRLPAERASVEGRTYIEHWSGVRRLLYTPVSDQHIYLALTTLDTDTAGKQVPIRADEWKRSFPHLAGVIDRIGEQGRWDLFEVVRLKRWSRGRVAIVGDAAHALAPNLGQGGGCALMNALALAVALDETPAIETALAQWERRERPLTEHTQRISSLYSSVTAMPSLLRSAILWWAGWSRWAIEQRTRTAMHIPTGTS
ncbi:NAD(P)/FAD-dependent oxidoreductase [Vineibacter terrae]|uniref:FAD-dependent oxidoreductase n=1 Tax=Vineibacter terrae TaxID=2586908 RepID=UPI002E34B439|nr:NAD(P)/FAD-dependent oxidoreductase [Vineibacter terrae]HEX2889489.1 NAD(P)/FAD-dependent oxidoreductase [Vineibacter terrae]